MDAALATLSLETLQTRLTESLDALHRLNTGPSAASYGDRQVQYQQRKDDLERYINRLQSAIATKQGTATRGPIYLV